MLSKAAIEVGISSRGFGALGIWRTGNVGARDAAEPLSHLSLRIKGLRLQIVLCCWIT